MSVSFFSNPQTLEELKRQYRDLAFKHHPDRGGDCATMQAVNAQYDKLHKVLKDVHANKEGEIYTATTESAETPEFFRDLIATLVGMDGLFIEIIGSFVWVTGNTKAHKDALKGKGFFWSSPKMAWYLKPEGYHRRSHRKYELEDIRGMFGVQGSYQASGRQKLAA